MGTSFCQVVRIIHMGQEIIDITVGNQKWHGGSPSLVRRPRNNIRFIKFVLHKRCWFVNKDIEPRRINPDPRAWAKKYFIEASVSLNLFEVTKRGIKDIRLSSRPNQIKTQWVLLIARKDPRTKEVVKRVVNGI